MGKTWFYLFFCLTAVSLTIWTPICREQSNLLCADTREKTVDVSQFFNPTNQVQMPGFRRSIDLIPVRRTNQLRLVF